MAIPKSGIQGISIEFGQDKGFYNSRVGDLVSKKAGLEKQNINITSCSSQPPETKIWLQSGHTKVVITWWSYQGSHNNKVDIITFEPKVWMPFPGIGSTETFVVKLGHSPILEK